MGKRAKASLRPPELKRSRAAFPTEGGDIDDSDGFDAPDLVERYECKALRKMRMLECYSLVPLVYCGGLELWARHVKKSLGDDLQKGLFHFRQQGIMFYTDYSGIECPKWGWEELCLALDDTDEEFSNKPFELWGRTCDNGTYQSQFLTKLHQMQGSKACHLSDVQDRLHDTAKEYIAGALPADDATKAERKEAYAEIFAWLLENRAWVYPPLQTAKQTKQERENERQQTNIGNQQVHNCKTQGR